MLTKSDFLKYIQCPKYLWLQKHRKDLIPEEIDENLQKLFDKGYEIETYAYKLFPDGVNVQAKNLDSSIVITKELMDKKSPAIFQPTISGKDLFCRADIIKLNEDGESWNIYEVKSSTKVKDINIYDLSFQKICFESVGYKIGKIYLLYINNQYIRHGEIESEKLLQKEDITEKVLDLEDDVKIKIEDALKIIKKDDEFATRILKQCDNPYECIFLDYCWKDIPENSIYAIAGGLNEDKLNSLVNEGILEIKDIPDGIVTSKAGLRHYNVVKQDIVIIEKENIKIELGQLQYPLYFLDYETFAPGVPLCDGYKPYQRMVFQYSLHIQEKPNGEVKHYPYLSRSWEDPSFGLANSLKNLIGDKGSVLAWNMSFEKGCNVEIGERYPEFQTFFENVNNRVFDLMQIFKKGYYAHKDFHGSASIKEVLPVLVPNLSYDELAIHGGGTASNKWGDMIGDKISQEEKEEIYNNLLTYCERDTLGMVKILEELNKIIK